MVDRCRGLKTYFLETNKQSPWIQQTTWDHVLSSIEYCSKVNLVSLKMSLTSLRMLLVSLENPWSIWNLEYLQYNCNLQREWSGGYKGKEIEQRKATCSWQGDHLVHLLLINFRVDTFCWCAKQRIEHVTHISFKLKTVLTSEDIDFIWWTSFHTSGNSIIEQVQLPLSCIVFWWLPWEFLNSTKDIGLKWVTQQASS